jgi:hypothetical protein
LRWGSLELLAQIGLELWFSASQVARMTDMTLPA